MSMSVSHVNAPENFEYSVRMRLNDSLLKYIEIFYLPNHSNILDYEYYASPFTGFYTWDGIDCWVYNEEKEKFITLYFTPLKI